MKSFPAILRYNPEWGRVWMGTGMDIPGKQHMKFSCSRHFRITACTAVLWLKAVTFPAESFMALGIHKTRVSEPISRLRWGHIWIRNFLSQWANAFGWSGNNINTVYFLCKPAPFFNHFWKLERFRYKVQLWARKICVYVFALPPSAGPSPCPNSGIATPCANERKTEMFMTVALCVSTVPLCERGFKGAPLLPIRRKF